MTDRLQTMEEKFGFLERHVEELDGLVRELFDRCDRLQRELTRLREDTQRRAEDDDHDPADDVPPHWGR